MDVALIFPLTAVVIPHYFSPTIVAAFKSPPNFRTIVLINALLGWTIVGWIAAMRMAWSAPKAAELPASPPMYPPPMPMYPPAYRGY